MLNVLKEARVDDTITMLICILYMIQAVLHVSEEGISIPFKLPFSTERYY